MDLKKKIVEFMRVLYFTSAPFYDIAIEMVNILKKDVELHLIMEVTQKNFHRAEICRLPDKKIIAEFSELINNDNYNILKPYINGCKSSNFVIHKSKSGFSFNTLKVYLKTYLFIKKINPDIIHIEEIGLRCLSLLPFLFSRRKIFLNIHDPLPHSGDKSWKVTVPQILFLKAPYFRSYFFYSQFAMKQFEESHLKDSFPKYLLRMYPYTYYCKYLDKSFSKKKHILFFGSLSYYKGINVLLKAMPKVFDNCPHDHLVIAGSKNENFDFDTDILLSFKEKITVLDRYISSKDLALLIQESKLVICPYLDASQSGVLMTAFAINTPVIASNVGAFPEYVETGINGVLVPANDPEKLAEAIINALLSNSYNEMVKNISDINKVGMWESNKSLVISAYNY